MKQLQKDQWQYRSKAVQEQHWQALLLLADEDDFLSLPAKDSGRSCTEGG
jgi:hypothetical protein